MELFGWLAGAVVLIMVWRLVVQHDRGVRERRSRKREAWAERLQIFKEQAAKLEEQFLSAKEVADQLRYLDELYRIGWKIQVEGDFSSPWSGDKYQAWHTECNEIWKKVEQKARLLLRNCAAGKDDKEWLEADALLKSTREAMAGYEKSRAAA